MDCSPQGFNHRSQHLQIHPAMHKTTQNETKLWKIKSPLSWSVLVASDCLNPYGICDLQICDIYKLTKNLSLSLPPLHHHFQFALNLPQTFSFLNIFLRFVFYSSLFPVCTYLPACIDSGPLHFVPLATTDGTPGFHPQTQSQNKNDTPFIFYLFICKIVYFFLDEELGLSLKPVYICEVR